MMIHPWRRGAGQGPEEEASELLFFQRILLALRGSRRDEASAMVLNNILVRISLDVKK